DESSKYGFSESFHLVPHSNGWYVRSCLFKWHDETPEDANGKDSETLAEEVEQEPKHELVNNHADETKKPTPEANVKAAAKEFKKPSNKRKGNHPKNRKLTNGISTPPPTPTKNAPPPQKDTKSPLVDAAPSTPSATDPPAPPSVAAPPAPTSATAPSAPASAPTSAT
uniref:Uncharacterized protein n=1 Tax=Panagrolaimus sp. ES5 TaxID=591445 RepID=A0AC34GMV3_9BILA